MFVARKELLEAALADPETRLKMNLATDWHEVEAVLADFVEKRGFKVVEVHS